MTQQRHVRRVFDRLRNLGVTYMSVRIGLALKYMPPKGQPTESMSAFAAQKMLRKRLESLAPPPLPP